MHFGLQDSSISGLGLTISSSDIVPGVGYDSTRFTIGWILDFHGSCYDLIVIDWTIACKE